MPKRPEAYMAERREQILEAMERCVSRDGWERATIDEVAREAGLSKGAVYVHFRSKRELLMGMVERSFAELEARADGLDFPTLRAEMVAGLVPLLRPDHRGKLTGLLETWIEGTRDPEISERLGLGCDRIVGLLAGLTLRLRPDLGADGARSWALKTFALSNGLAVLCGFGLTVSEAELNALFDVHFRSVLA